MKTASWDRSHCSSNIHLLEQEEKHCLRLKEDFKIVIAIKAVSTKHWLEVSQYLSKKAFLILDS